ncbi:CaiB/BaiF CoA transferase family protein [Paramicrobacterium agarici]|uniref:CoA:oxalate CoA-transferase n=1 Tax=Paramicrobacterium agarici TaxID=630514 RepID=A0A2A9DVD5_9MICO|nr:CoA transferase [Microbacterium agarici]PFG29910.1 CoA:oxalate CoA-transferase [Microbacterium agarici]
MVAQPLTGLKVLDLTRFIAGPLCCQILADMGAEVIKIERPGGEDSRKLAPFYQGHSIYTMLYSRNKHGGTLDTRHPEALAILEDLIRNADIVVENYRPGTLDAMGIPYERMQELHPGIILVSISGFGQTGPLAGRALFDGIAQAASGLMSMTGERDGRPTLTGAFVADYIAGYQGAIGALLAVLHHRATGEGQCVDVASIDALFPVLGTAPSAWAMNGTVMERNGSRDRMSGPANLFETKDGFLYLHAGTDPLFRRLAVGMGQAELADNERFSTVASRMDHIEEIERIVAEWIAPLTCAEAGEVLEEAGVPYGKVAGVDEITDSEQIAAREMMVDVEHPVLGTLKLPGIPVKLSATPGSIRKAPPLVGEDNDFIFGTLLGYSDERIQELRDEQVI